jgi:adenosylmethionine-8-amino-7-oxononanoate aminotransferase
MVMDEVMSGMGRTGTLHAWQHEGVSPDIQTFGKALGAGYVPIAGLLVSKKVVDVLDKGTGSFVHGQTYQGHPVACAAAFEVQTIVKEQKLLENVQEMGGYLSGLLKQKLNSHPNVGEIRGRGLFWGVSSGTYILMILLTLFKIEFVKDKATKEAFDTSVGVAQAIHSKGLHPGYDICVIPATGSVDGIRGDHIIISPAYNITKADVETIVDRIQRVIEDYFTSLGV